MEYRKELLDILKSEIGEFKVGEPPHFISNQVRLKNILSSSSSSSSSSKDKANNNDNNNNNNNDNDNDTIKMIYLAATVGVNAAGA